MRASHRTFLLLALLSTVVAVPALAQQPAPSAAAALSTYPACTKAPTQADTDAAHGAYMAGKGSFDEADYTTALNYFKDAYRRDCTKHELLIIIARAFELKGDKREAVHALETYLERVPNAQDAEVQKRRIANLKREITDAPVTPPPPASTPASTASAAPAPAPTTTATTTPTATSPSEPLAPARGHTVPPWIVTGAGGAAIVTGVVLYAVGSGKVSDAEKLCPNHVCPSPAAIDSGNSGRTLESVGVVTAVVGVAAVAGGLIWHFVEPTGARDSAKVTPVIGPGYAGVSGRF